MDSAVNLSNSEPQMARKRMNKTQRALVYALIALLDKREFSKISVNELCEEALVSRSSFYVHFQDKYDLLRFSLAELQKKLSVELPGRPPREQIARLVENVENNARVLTHLAADSNAELHAILHETVCTDMQRLIARQGTRFGPAIPADVLSVYYAGGISSLLFWWIGTRFAVPKEEMAEYIYQIFEKI